jgi:hypothetical protein
MNILLIYHNRFQDEETIVIGDYLELGIVNVKLRKYTSGVVVGIAREAKDLATFPEGSESSAKGAYYNPRIAVQII